MTGLRLRVAAGFLLALALVAGIALLFLRSAERAQRSLRYIQVSVEEPLEHLGQALDANAAGQSLLHLAVATTHDERNSLLSQSIAMAETAAQEWQQYQAKALDLPGEAELAATYERDYEAGKMLAGSVLVPIVRSDMAVPLPAEQVAAADLNRQNLLALQELYEREDRETLRSLAEHYARERDAIVIGAAALATLLLLGLAFALRAAGRQVAERRRQAAHGEFTEFESGLIKALEFADNDDDAFRVAHRAFRETDPDAAVSMVAVEAGQERFAPLISAPPCGVTSAAQCPASRSGTPVQFSDSGALDACPTLAAGATDRCAVSCVPVSVAGLHAAVVQLTGPVGAPPDLSLSVTAIARRLGERLTTMRALSASQTLASRDPLTGLLNRRSFAEAVGRLAADGTTFAIAFADLDHFKGLNDLHGHDAGDRALRAFATTLKGSLRPDDTVARWGGEEFVVVLQDCDMAEAVEVMDRARARLAAEVLEGTDLMVTMSVGVAVRGPDEPFDVALGRADHALRLAKAGGRNRVQAWSPAVERSKMFETEAPLLAR